MWPNGVHGDLQMLLQTATAIFVFFNSVAVYFSHRKLKAVDAKVESIAAVVEHDSPAPGAARQAGTASGLSPLPPGVES
jgi:hypothetical protein